MNGRTYDPVVGRMLSLDNYVQNPFGTQSYNRYSYALSNPLKYIYPSGNDILDVIFTPFRLVNEGINWLNAQMNGESYAYDWNYVSTGQLSNTWRNNPCSQGAPNGYPIGPYGEYNAFGGPGTRTPILPPVFERKIYSFMIVPS